MKMGDKLRDKLTGFEGVAVATTDWFYGCRRFGLQPSKLKDGLVQDIQWFDELQLEVIKADAMIGDTRKVKTGGPRPDPSSRRAGE